MKIIVVGLGVQGLKRIKEVGDDLVFTVDPQNKNANFSSVREVPLELYDSAILAVPDAPKYDLLIYLLNNSKHVLVEKPLMLPSVKNFFELEELASKKKTFLYTAYNHRFEPNIKRAKTFLENNHLGEIYACNLYYGNGTAQLVKNSPWRDQNSGVLADLGSHLFDLIDFWFKAEKIESLKSTLSRLENMSPDSAQLSFEMSNIQFNLGMTYCSWKNTFRCEIIGEKGSIQISSLCKWGDSEFVHLIRKLPSGKPLENRIIEPVGDKTFKKEYEYFKKKSKMNFSVSLLKDRWIYSNIKKVYDEY